MKYKSELIHEILEQRGHEKSTLHYQSECVKSWVDETKGAYPKLCDYESEWLNYINENPIGEFPYETVTANNTATINNVVPLEYKSAILKGQTLVNVHPTDYIVAGSSTTFFLSKIIPKTMIKPNTRYFLRLYNTHQSIVRAYFKPCVNDSANLISSDNKCAIFTTKSEFTEYDFNNNKIHFYSSSELALEDVKDTKVILCEYVDGMENWDIPYFEGMQSVKMPVLMTTGKNLCDGVREYSGANDVYGANFIKVEEGKRYAIYQEDKNYLRIDGYSNNKEFVRYITGGDVGLITIPSGVKYIKWRYPLYGEPYNENSKIMIALSDIKLTLSDYEPFKSNILTVNEEVELRGIGDVKDTLDLTTGELTQKVCSVTLNGEEVWSKTNSNNTHTMYTHIVDELPTATASYNMLCDKIKTEFYINTIAKTYESITMRNGTTKQLLLCLSNDKASDVVALKQWLSQNPITVQYPLATPTIKTVDLTVVNQDGEPLSKIKPIEGTMHIEVSGTPINPTAVLEVPVEAITQNLNSFIEEE